VIGQMGDRKFDYRLRQDIFRQTYSPAVVLVPPHMQWAKGGPGAFIGGVVKMNTHTHTHTVQRL